jgi:predicted DNA-binding transcriptional regulator AlpA
LSSVIGREPEIPRRLVQSPRETEVLLGLSHASIYRLIGAGRLVAIKIGGRTAITRESIERLCAEGAQ